LTKASVALRSRAPSGTTIVFASLSLLASAATFMSAQGFSSVDDFGRAPAASEKTMSATALLLPDAPGFTSSSASTTDTSSSATGDLAEPSDADAAGSDHHPHIPRLHEITIEPGQTAPPLSSHAKVVLGLKESFTFFSAVGWTASAGFSQLTNGSPNYGTDSGAFGERLGATSLRLISQNIIGNAFFAPLFHEDPRYYKMGGRNVGRRVFYAATRTLITKSDDGRSRPNFSLLSGHLAGAALTNTYYPSINRGFRETAETFGNAIGGSALGFGITEFLNDVLRFAHLEKLE
jgi:hypothetical protein